jgi:hypothetical protein
VHLKVTGLTEGDLFSINPRQQFVKGAKTRVDGFDMLHMMHLNTFKAPTGSFGAPLFHVIYSGYLPVDNRKRVTWGHGAKEAGRGGNEHWASKVQTDRFTIFSGDFQDYVQSEPPYDFRTAKVLFTSDSLQQALPEDPMDPREFSFIVHKSEVISIAIHDGAVSNDQFLAGKSEEVFRIHES